MNSYYNVHVVWLVMLALTGLAFTMGQSDVSGLELVALILFTSVTKGFFIIRDFMALKDVSLLWKVIMYGWLWCVCIVIAITYLIGH